MRAYLHAADALREDAACDGAAAGIAADALGAGVEALRAAAVAFLPVCSSVFADTLCAVTGRERRWL